MSGKSSRVALQLDQDESFYEHAVARGWTDGLPVIAPTEERVARMLAATPAGTPESLGRIAPRQGEAVLETIAANAVMAGCSPEYFPILLAAVSLLADERMATGSMQATTSPASPVLIVNGAVRLEIGLNASRGCLGPGHRANTTIGRALRLVLLNVGGGVPDEVDKSTHGLPEKFGICFAEHEEDSPWESLHDEFGLQPGSSSVTMTSIISITNVRLPDPRPTAVSEEIHILADALAQRGAKAVQSGKGRPVLVLSVGTARIFAAAGYDKNRLRAELFESAQRVGPYLNQPLTNYLRHDGMVLPYENPDDLVIVVAGGPEPNQALVMTSFVDSAVLSTLVLPGRT